jgi:NADPH-dependent F420 reductase
LEDPVPRQLSISELESFPSVDWFEIAPRITPALRSAVERILETQEGASISNEDAFTLAHAEGDDLLGLLSAANLLRAELAGNIVTYVVNRNINFTNICFVGCKFCAFSRGPRESDTYFLDPDQVAQKAIEAWQLGATEVCIQGGLPHGLPPFYYRDILRAVKKAVPGMHIHAFSPMEIVYGVELTGMPLADYLSMLRDNGLGTLPGTAAEILDDAIRHILSANKLSTAQWIEVIRTAHQNGIRSTSTMMYGHTETPEHWVRQMLLLREIQQETGGFTEFVPLGFVHQNTLLFHQGLARSGPTLAEHLKVHALSRLLLAGSINNIQVSWVKLNRRRQRLRRHTHGRKHFARSWSYCWPVHQPRGFSIADSRNGPRPRRAQHHLHAHQAQASTGRIHCGRNAGDGICMSDASRPIAILGGTGPAGMGVALRWARAGETIIIGSRDPHRAQEAADSIKKIIGDQARVSGMENSAACAAADLLVLTVPFEGQAALLKQLKPAIRPGSILIDATVALAASVGGRASRTLGVWQGSSAQQAAELAPKGVSVVAAFHNLSAELLNGDDPLDCDVIVCSDDANAAQLTRILAAKIPGVRAIDGGKLENARILEQITALLVGLNIRHKGHGGIRITGLPPEAYK